MTTAQRLQKIEERLDRIENMLQNVKASFTIKGDDLKKMLSKKWSLPYDRKK